MIAIHDLSHRYGRHWALARLTLEAPTGQCLCLFGPNGAGKTTLLHILATLITPTAGDVTVGGVSLRGDPLAVRRLIGLVAHKPLLYAHLTALENLDFFGRLYRIPGRKQRAESLLERVGLWDKRHDRVRGFSHGQTQRAAIARALMHDPAVLLLDEPYAGLDLAAAERLDGLLADLIAAGHTLIMTTHDLDRGVERSSRFAILAVGRLIYQAESRSVTRETLRAVYARAFAQGQADA
ncbi:MAG: ABC transporter ATP-binding protein [Anaerolineae bacterium]